ncbi:MAG TPA: DNA polymerase III subunit gamma/tau [Candidatus Paceibacterota bacterium]|nr:DNA polymerase III subunit gamma/tau [Candidatus Paceibacterota bacterium]
MLAIYRKYRPTTFDDVIGQELTVSTLKEAARRDRIAHAYLLSGPRGTGKTTTARLIAKIANCEKREKDSSFRSKGEPCNECTSCRDINSGRAMDVVEIDAASNRGIDDVRGLKEIIATVPGFLKHKVFIIDEAHMLTKEAFNALLKTLEEPPPYVILILATTEAEKIPATISSRTQQFYFKRVPLDKIAGKLESIAKEENIKISNEAIELIASSAEGSFRDAESLLDQLSSFGDAEISLDDVEKALGKIGFDKLSEIADYLLRGKIDESLGAISAIEDGGFNLSQLVKDLIQYLRRAAVLKYSPEMKADFERELMSEHLEKLVGHARIFGDNHIELIKALIRAYNEMRYSEFPIIPLEVAVVESLKK